MSVEMMGMAWEESVPPPQKLALLKIADEAGDDGAFKVDQLAAAKACSIDEVQFMQCMACLEADGLLSVTARTCGPAGHVIVHGQLTLKPAALSAQKRD